MSLGTWDYEKLLKVIEDLCSAQTAAEVRQATREGLSALVPGDCYDVVLFASSRPENDAFFANPGTYTAEEIRYMLTNVGDHPLAEVFLKGDPGAICISQRISSREWQNCEFYRESGYQRLGLRHELAVLVPDVSRTSLAALSVLRSRDFSERDREILNRLRWHLGRAWKRTVLAKNSPSSALVQKTFPVLSSREAEVLFWITEGKQNREIADILQRSLTTVQEHVENIIRKLGMENRHATAVFALRALLEG
ncbi:MAG TPA: LuxR C-terminal-related transcriptional regulator [Terrimicrobiaceae bacterium]|nr:LuxR C-terminal-related transcriptional regulator [Terrimicrobiaceae bacterium]